MIKNITNIILTNSGDIHSFSSLRQKFKNVYHFPMIKIKYTEYELDFGEFDYAVFCSKNSVKSLVQNITNDKFPKNLKCISIGTKTSKLLEKFGFKIFLTSKKSYSKEMIEDIKEINDLKDSKLLLMQGNLSSNKIYNDLKNITNVKKVISYQTTMVKKKSVELENLLYNKETITVFTSPSSFDAFCLNYNPESTKIVSIGKTTSDYIANKDFKIELTSKMQTFEKISDEILKNY